MTSPRHQSCSLHRWWFEAFLEYLEVPCLFPRSKQAVKVLEQLISKQVSTWKIFDTRISHKFSNAKVPKKSSYFQVFARYPLNPWKRYSCLCFVNCQRIKVCFSVSGLSLPALRDACNIKGCNEKDDVLKNSSLWNPCGEHIHGVGYQPRKSKLLTHKKSCCVPCIKKNTMERWNIIWIHLQYIIPDQVLSESKLERFVQGILMLGVDVRRQPPEFLDVSDWEMLVLAWTLAFYQFLIITFPKKNSRHSRHMQMFQMKLKSKTTSLPALPLQALPYMFFRSGQSLLCQ